MDTISSFYSLMIGLTILVLIAAFFSAAETGMMALNRYRLRHLVREKHLAARRAQKLLQQPDRLLGVILIINNCANTSASAIATMIAERLYGNTGVAIAVGVLTFVLLVFGEVAPKTLAALYPQRCAFIATWPLIIVLKLLYPLVWLVNVAANTTLRLFGFSLQRPMSEHLSLEELRTIVYEAGGKIPLGHQSMLLRILDLEKVTVDDVMVPRNEIIGIDVKDQWGHIMEKVSRSVHRRLPVYSENINQLHGFLNLHKVQPLLMQKKLTRELLMGLLEEAYFIPEGTSLNTQLLNFREQKMRGGLVVDEYGEILGLVTVEDIIEEIMGDLRLGLATPNEHVQLQPDGSYLVKGNINLRELNRTLGWDFDITGPKTLSGLITEQLEAMPQAGVSLRISGYPIEVVEVKHNRVRLAKVFLK